MGEYRLIDSDSHINEPPGLWLERVPDRFRDQVPRIERLEQGDAWVMEGVKDPINFGLNAAATVRRADRKPWVRFEDIPAGGHDPSARLEEMDVDMDLVPEDDPVWEAAIETGLPLHVHVKLVDEYPQDIYAPGRITQGRSEG